MQSTTKEFNTYSTVDATPAKGNTSFFARQTETIFSFANIIMHFFSAQTMNERRARLEFHLGKLMIAQKAANEGIQPVDLSYLLTGRGARRRAITTNVPHKT